MNDVNSLSHRKWNCKYHIVFAPKYRRKVFYGEKRREIGEILRTLCNWKKIRIVEAEVCPDHVHMLVEIPPKVAVSSFMGYLKGKSSSNDLREVPGTAVQVQEPRILVSRVLRRYGGKECEEDPGVHSSTIRRGQSRRTTDHGEFLTRLRVAGSKILAAGRPYLRDVTRGLLT